MTKSRMNWEEHEAHMEDRRSAYRVLVGKPERKRPLGIPRHGWEDNIKMDLQEGGGEAWSGLIRNWTGTGGGHL
jgi:hypothetical protein